MHPRYRVILSYVSLSPSLTGRRSLHRLSRTTRHIPDLQTLTPSILPLYQIPNLSPSNRQLQIQPCIPVISIYLPTLLTSLTSPKSSHLLSLVRPLFSAPPQKQHPSWHLPQQLENRSPPLLRRIRILQRNGNKRNVKKKLNKETSTLKGSSSADVGVVDFIGYCCAEELYCAG
jgi:hypothetical protein